MVSVLDLSRPELAKGEPFATLWVVAAVVLLLGWIGVVGVPALWVLSLVVGQQFPIASAMAAMIASALLVLAGGATQVLITIEHNTRKH